MGTLDPRWFQVGSLVALLAASILWLDLAATWPQSLVMIGAALAAQRAACAVLRLRFDPLSPLVTGLSLSLLLRTHDPVIWIIAPGLAVGSKFLLRVNGKHLFNPAAIGIVALLGAGANVWVSPGQWGTRGLVAAAVVALGGLVLSRARRIDTAAVFFVAYTALLVARGAWLGDPWIIPVHQLESGSLLIFTCFMITDPRSTPDRRAGRAAFGVAVAAVAYALQFELQLRTGLFWSLAAVSLTTPLIDALLPGERFRWRSLEA